MTIDATTLAVACLISLLAGTLFGVLLHSLKRDRESIHEIGAVDVDCVSPTRVKVTILNPPDLTPLEWYDTQFAIGDGDYQGAPAGTPGSAHSFETNVPPGQACIRLRLFYRRILEGDAECVNCSSSSSSSSSTSGSSLNARATERPM